MELGALFQFGEPAYYLSSTTKTISCKVFIDIGWHYAASGYETHVAELITIVTISLADIPDPKVNDKIQIGKNKYHVVSVQAQDDLIAALHVKKI